MIQKEKVKKITSTNKQQNIAHKGVVNKKKNECGCGCLANPKN